MPSRKSLEQEVIQAQGCRNAKNDFHTDHAITICIHKDFHPANRICVRHVSGVVIECLDYAAFITRYDGRDTLFYLDPPYWGCENDYGKAMFSRDDFAAMAAQLAAIKGKFLLSLNDVPGVREVFQAFEITAVQTSYSIGQQANGSGKSGEVLIGNFGFGVG